jgi:hypothetical protein
MKTRGMVWLNRLSLWITPVILALFTGIIADPNNYGETSIYEPYEPTDSTVAYLIMGLSYPVYLLLMYLLDHFGRKRRREWDAFASAEQKRLERIRASMTPAEWANYEIQMEIKHKLDNLPRNNSSSTRYGMFTDFGD